MRNVQTFIYISKYNTACQQLFSFEDTFTNLRVELYPQRFLLGVQ